jgi:hypothetical protein
LALAFLQPEHGKAIAEGYNVVVDLDLERFFDRVNHDSLMARVAASPGSSPSRVQVPYTRDERAAAHGQRIGRSQPGGQGNGR